MQLKWTVLIWILSSPCGWLSRSGYGMSRLGTRRWCRSPRWRLGIASRWLVTWRIISRCRLRRYRVQFGRWFRCTRRNQVYLMCGWCWIMGRWWVHRFRCLELCTLIPCRRRWIISWWNECCRVRRRSNSCTRYVCLSRSSRRIMGVLVTSWPTLRYRGYMSTRCRCCSGSLLR